MKDKIIAITSSTVAFPVTSPLGGGQNIQMVTQIFGLGESGTMYQLEGREWKKVTESPTVSLTGEKMVA